jgi:hypothetical protein
MGKCNCGKSSCNSCNTCNSCSKCQRNCACAMEISALCVVYEGKDLEILGVKQCDRLDYILSLIDNYLAYLESIITDKFIGINVGDASEIYKGLNSEGVHEFRTLLDSESVYFKQSFANVTASINTTWLDTYIPETRLENLGSGISIFTDETPKNFFKLRTLSSNAGTVDITQLPDGGLNFELSPEFQTDVLTINSEGIGVPILRKSGKNAFTASLNSGTLKIENDGNGTININSISTESNYLKVYYVNSNYVPTVDSPADGSIIRPFPTFDKAITKMIGNGTILNPENAGARIIVQTNSSTNVNPTINTVTIELQNVALLYTGSDLYMFDTEILYPLVPKDGNNEITQSVYMAIVGNGTLQRDNGIGVVRTIGAKRGGSTTVNNNNVIYIRLGEKETDNITVSERTSYPDNIWEGDVMSADGVTKVGDAYNPPLSLKWTTQLNPTTPLVYVKGNSFVSYSYSIFGAGKLNIKTLANIGLYVDGTNPYWNKLQIKPHYNRITVNSVTVGIPGYPDVYEPKGFPAIFAKNSIFYIDSIFSEEYGFSYLGWDTFIKVEGDFSLVGKFDFFSYLYMETFADLTNSLLDYFQINGKKGNANLESQIKYLIDSPINGNFNLIMTNSVITGVKTISKNPNTNVIAQTGGTLGSLNGVTYLSGLTRYNDDTNARAAGLITNGMYINNTTDSLTTV